MTGGVGYIDCVGVVRGRELRLGLGGVLGCRRGMGLLVTGEIGGRGILLRRFVGEGFEFAGQGINSQWFRSGGGLQW